MFFIRRLPCRNPQIFRCLSSEASTPNPYAQPSSARYDELIYEAGRSRDLAAVGRLLHNRFRDGFFNTARTFRFITAATPDLPALLRDLSQTLARLDRGFCRKGAFDSLIARLCRLGLVDDALRAAEAMDRGGYGANACTYHPILNALSRRRQGRLSDARRVLDLMRERGIAPDATAYNYILTAHCFAGDLEEAAAVLAEMAEGGMEADARTYDALVLGACRAGKVEGALAVLRRMEDDGVPALYSTHAHVINAMLKAGYRAQAVKFVMCYAGKDSGLDTESFGWLARRFIASNRVEEAKVVLGEMKKRNLAMGEKLRDFCNLHFIC